MFACDVHSADNKTDKNSSTWLDHLSEMFPLSPKDNIASVVQQAKSLDEAAEHVYETLEEQEAPSSTVTEKREKLYFSSVESAVDTCLIISSQLTQTLVLFWTVQRLRCRPQVLKF